MPVSYTQLYSVAVSVDGLPLDINGVHGAHDLLEGNDPGILRGSSLRQGHDRERSLFLDVYKRQVIIHVGAQVAFQCALRFFVGRLIKVAGVGLAQQYDLQCIDDR